MAKRPPDKKTKAPQAGLQARRANRQQTPTAKTAARRREILDAAAETFRITGYESATLAEIGARANVNRASLYYYFSTKEELLVELIAPPMLANVERMAATVASAASAREKIEQAVNDLVDAFDASYPILSVYFEERVDRVLANSTAPEHAELAAAQDRYLELWAELLAEGRESGDLQFDGPPRLAAYMVIGMLRYTGRWYRAGGDLSASEVGRLYATTLLRGVAAG